MKIHKPVKHARRKAMIAQRKAKGKYSKVHLPRGRFYGSCFWRDCSYCWANGTRYCS